MMAVTASALRMVMALMALFMMMAAVCALAVDQSSVKKLSDSFITAALHPCIQSDPRIFKGGLSTGANASADQCVDFIPAEQHSKGAMSLAVRRKNTLRQD